MSLDLVNNMFDSCLGPLFCISKVSYREKDRAFVKLELAKNYSFTWNYAKFSIFRKFQYIIVRMKWRLIEKIRERKCDQDDSKGSKFYDVQMNTGCH